LTEEKATVGTTKQNKPTIYHLSKGVLFQQRIRH